MDSKDTWSCSFGSHNSGTQIGINHGSIYTEFPNVLELPAAPYAGFDSIKDQHKNECYPGTRVDILKKIQDWALSTGCPGAFWLNGAAGTGKSTIARSVAGRFQEKQQLGASFFFKRGEGTRGNSLLFISTIAKQLAKNIPNLKAYVEQAIKEEPGIENKRMRDQFNMLILHPLRSLKTASSTPSSSQLPSFLIVIDALDECEGYDNIRLILQLLSQLQNFGSVSLKVFLTSRPEEEIQLGFSKFTHNESLALHEVQEEQINADLAIYWDIQLAKINDEQGQSVYGKWDKDGLIQRLVKYSSPLFISAAVLSRCLEDPIIDLSGILSRVFDWQKRTTERPVHEKPAFYLQETYGPVLHRVSQEFINLDGHYVEDFRKVVGTIVSLESPLSVASLSKLIKISKESIRNSIRYLHSVLEIPKDESLPIRPFHLSFRDFLVSENARQITPLAIDSKSAHIYLTTRCFLICRGLRRNIFDLSDEGTPRIRLGDEALRRNIPTEMEYACRYWAYHLAQVLKGPPISSEIDSERRCKLPDVLQFLHRHFLHWIEAMIYLDQIGEVIGIINSLLDLAPLFDKPEILEFLDNAKRFFLMNCQTFEDFPLQLYSAALIFPPQNGFRHIFEDDLPKWISQYPLVSDSSGPVLQTLEGHQNEVFKVLFSSDGQLMASMSEESIRLWNPFTGIHQHSISITKRTLHLDHSIVLSPNGRFLASTSRFGILSVWNATTGEHQWDLRIDTYSARMIKFSPDSRLVATVSGNGELKVHYLRDGISSFTIEWETTAVDFSPDGLFLSSGHRDGQVKIYEVASRQCKATIPNARDGVVRSVMFSPDSSLLAAGFSYKAIGKLWETKGFTPRLTSNGVGTRMDWIVFSPHSQLLALATNLEIQVWELNSDGATLKRSLNYHKLEKYASEICILELAFLSDNASIVIVSDKSIHIFDWTATRPTQFFKTNLEGSPMVSACLTPDYHDILLTSGYKNGVVRLWNLRAISGKNEELQNKNGPWIKPGGKNQIVELSFSPNGRKLASSYDNGGIAVWDTHKQNRECYLSPLDAWCGRGAIAFSHDGHTLASMPMELNKILLWNLKNGSIKTKLQLLYAGRCNDKSCALAFSSTGLLASAKKLDIILWDSVSGAKLQIWSYSGWITGLQFNAGGILTVSKTDYTTIKPGVKVFWKDLTRVTTNGWRSCQIMRKNSVWMRSKLTAKEAWIDRREDPQISLDQDHWICLNNEKKIWLPPDFRPQAGRELMRCWYPDENLSPEGESTIAVGLASGEVFFLRFKRNCH